MLEKARERVARKGRAQRPVLQMDAASLKFADDTFDIVYARYVIRVVRIKKSGRRRARECAALPPGRRIVILNHFRSKNRLGADRARDFAVTVHIGFKSDLDLRHPRADDLKPVSIEKGESPAYLVARDVRERLTNSQLQVSSLNFKSQRSCESER